MQQFTVPQFIDVEDKVLGPITARQFIIMLAVAMCSAITYKLADFVWFVILSVIYLAAGGVLAFLRINGRPFHYFILNVIQTLKKPKLRVWNHLLAKSAKELKGDDDDLLKPVPKVQRKPVYARSKLAELALIVDTGGAYGGGDDDIQV